MLKVKKYRGNVRIAKVKLCEILQRKLKQLAKCSWVINEKRRKKCGFCVSRVWWSLKILKLHPSTEVAVWGQALGIQRMPKLTPNWRWMDIRVWKQPHLKGTEISKSWVHANRRNWTSSTLERRKKWPWNCKFSSEYLKLIYGGLEAVLENSNLRRARKMPWATTGLLVSSKSAKWSSCQRMLQAFLNFLIF